jgi:hypothetical protein
MKPDIGLDVLLSLDGTEYTEKNGYWYKIEAMRVQCTKERPHGIRYNLTLHDNYNQRILGFDNAHAVKPKGNKRYAGRKITYDHAHYSMKDKGTHYSFSTAEQLLNDFFKAVNLVMQQLDNGAL